MRKKTLDIFKGDPWLEDFQPAILARYDYAVRKEAELTQGKSLSDFADGYLYFGLHFEAGKWVFREWAPNATAIHLLCDTNDWKCMDDYALQPIGNGVWEAFFRADALHHNEHYKLFIEWEGGSGERIPAWAQRVVQDNRTGVFSAQVWEPENPYHFVNRHFRPRKNPLLIYECHIGMAVEEERVGTYEEFRVNVLPRIARLGYNAVQIMAIQEHPYYGSFGYHVSSFFAPSSRFGTPEELKHLIDDAHGLGLSVIMDIVHSHAVKNTQEGLGLFDGDKGQYFFSDRRRNHPAWDSLCFNYGKNEVMHFLLSNCKYWMEVFHFDGFRFDGVTSMIYWSHGLNDIFYEYGDYFRPNVNGDALCYLTLANKLIHEVNPYAITIAEEVSGMPGLGVAVRKGGVGFDYRLAMGIPDYWIKIIKEEKDEHWRPGSILWELTNRRNDEQTISYSESHDQAMVGDKTIIFRLVDSDMYWHMGMGDHTASVDRGMALHKIIRMMTASTINGGYLNFMGNEFGHPEWIDFPREGNGWSHKFARRQWSLADSSDLKYHLLQSFDRALMRLIRHRNFNRRPLQARCVNDGDQVAVFERGDLLFVFNLSPVHSYTDYGVKVSKGSWQMVLNTDSTRFGGYGLVDERQIHFTSPSPKPVEEGLEWLKLYLPARTGMAFEKLD